jgi:DNA-binding HxlR family transcriptional regulator
VAKSHPLPGEYRPRPRGRASSERALGRVTGESAASSETDRLLYDRVRLGMLSALAVNETLTFSELKRLLKATDGNLSVHARKLENAGLVTCTKTFEGRLPKTEYRLTAAGRRLLEKFLNHMEALIRATREA